MDDNKATVRAVERALDILLCFTSGTDLAMTEIAERTQLHKSTVHRLLATLEAKGFIVRDPATERYRLGLRVWELSAHLSTSDEPSAVCLPEMERLRDTLGETISLYLRDGYERIRIQAVQSDQAIRRVAPVGVRLPLYVGASSKVLIAFSEPAEQAEIMASLAWPPSIDQDGFRAQLDEIYRMGYAISVEEREPGAAAVSAPVFGRSGKCVAALSVSGPSSRLTRSRLHGHAPDILEAARRMGTMLK